MGELIGFRHKRQGNEDAVIIVQSAKFCSDFLRSRLCVYARSPKINHIN